MRILPLEFYQQEDTLALSQELLGKLLFTQWEGGERCAGIIVETEAYMGPEDKASHAYNNRRTARTEIMFHEGGVSYVYLCYGMHHLFNIVTHREGTPHAILIRAIEPIEGVQTMLARSKRTQPTPLWTSGPALLTQALGIKVHHTGIPLNSSHLWIEDHGIVYSSDQIIAGPRVGVSYAKEYADRPWRFRIHSFTGK